MDKDFLIQLTTNLYRLTLLFPKKEPLRYKMRELADEILAKCLRSNLKQNPVLEDLEVLDSFFEVAKAQNWVSPAETLKLQQEYSKLKENLETQANSAPAVQIRDVTRKDLVILSPRTPGDCGESPKESPRTIEKRVVKEDKSSFPPFVNARVVKEDKSSSSATESRLRDEGGKECKALFDFANARVVKEDKSSFPPFAAARVVKEDKSSFPPFANARVNERQQKILEILKEREKAQVWEIKKFFPEVAKRTLRRDFEFLLQEGAVERIGERNDTFYQLKG